MVSRFGGGVSLPGYKTCTKDLKFKNIAIPHHCYIPLRQHVGAAAKPVVNKGDTVLEGQLIARAVGPGSANVHSSVPGRVADIVKISAECGGQDAIIVESEGSFSSTAYPQKFTDWASLTEEETLKKIDEAGIVGLGGSLQPAIAKLTPTPGRKITTLIVNGAECEPFLTADDMLMKTYPEAIVEGALIIMKVLGITRGVIGIGGDKRDARKALEKVLSSLNPPGHIVVKKLKAKYPQGAEMKIVLCVLGKELASGSSAADNGVIVQNAGTVFAIREAVAFGRALFMRHITVSGGAISRPGNYKVRIGTRISHIIDECGGFKISPAKIIMGGPMRGTCIDNMDIPVTKGTSGLLFLTDREAAARSSSTCIRCGKCVAACPMRLLPYEMGNAIEREQFDIAKELNLNECVGCGSCSYVCPAGRPLGYYFASAREQAKELNI